MEPRLRKTNSNKYSCDIPSPVLLRRRLSAPETVMRKYKLARARSQESDPGQASDSKFGELSHESHSGSDLNLQKKKDSAVLMRKSTLLRRLMTNPKTFGSSSFQEWQHYCGKLSTPSLNSLQGSPEHLSKSYSRRSLVGYEFKTSPKHTSYGSRKVSPVRQLYEPNKNNLTQMNTTSPKRRIDVHHDNYTHPHSYFSHSTNSKTTSMSSLKTNTSNDIQVTNSRTTIEDHSDSAYSNDRSNFSPATMSSCSTNTNLTTQQSSLYKKENISTKNLDQRVMDENRNYSVNTSFNYVTQESSTQTSSTTNLNVISNVKLSKETLDLIVNEVMRDVQKSYSNGNEVEDQTGDSIHVQKISGFQEKPSVINSHQDEISEYKNNTEAKEERVTSSRLSALSSKTSMEARSENFTDDNFDIVSLADSLEETASSKMSLKNHDDKPVRGDLPRLPTNSHKHSSNNIKQADAFFIPMKTDVQTDVKSVSHYLPEKLRDKILQRQQDLQDKLNQNKSSFTSQLTHLSEKTKKTFFKKSVKSVNSKVKEIRDKARYKKPFLPSLDSTKKLKAENKENTEQQKSKNRFKRKTKENIQKAKRSNKESERESAHSFSEKHFRMYRTENEYVYDGGPKKIYHKAEFRNSNKRIEILEIMECLDLSTKDSQSASNIKSKIPVLVNQKPSTINHAALRKPTYLDFDRVVTNDPKLDQLIANILIQSLHEKEEYLMKEHEVQNDSTGKTDSAQKHQQEFESIPEELPRQTTNGDIENLTTNGTAIKEDELKNNNNFITKEVPIDEPPQSKENTYYKGRAAVELPRAENSSTLPDGWVAFYMPQKSEDSVDNASSSEGIKPDTRTIEDRGHLSKTEESNIASGDLRKFRTVRERFYEDYDFERNGTNTKRADLKNVVLPPPIPRRYGHSSRRPRYRSVPNAHSPPGEWSIVLSGKNNAPFTSDLEMKIRFPNSHQNYDISTQSRHKVEENRETHHRYEEGPLFPRLDEKYLERFNEKKTQFYNGNQCHQLQRLPEISKKMDKDNQKVSDSMAALRAMDITDMRPRQTKTSLRRYKMTRPKLHPLFESNIYDFGVDRNYPEILRRLPQLLSVNGNSIKTERKYHVPGMDRRDIPKHNCTPH